jgi:nucleotide-binding universal stress UspA family protein
MSRPCERTKIDEIKRRRKMIPQIKKILYTTDLTKNSLYAFYFAIDLARKHDASILILHCIGPVLHKSSWEASIIDVPKLMEKMKEDEKERDIDEIKKEIQQFCQSAESQIGTHCADLVSEVIVKEGHPVEEILNMADTRECDVIVLGTHGKGWLKHAFLGSVASSVLERTRKPVFIIPLPSEKNSNEAGTF